MQNPLGHGVLSMLPSQRRTPDAGVSARQKASLRFASAYLTKAAQWISSSRLRMQQLYTVRDLFCVSRVLHRLVAFTFLGAVQRAMLFLRQKPSNSRSFWRTIEVRSRRL
jgi:hypothetical protein